MQCNDSINSHNCLSSTPCTHNHNQNSKKVQRTRSVRQLVLLLVHLPRLGQLLLQSRVAVHPLLVCVVAGLARTIGRSRCVYWKVQ